MPTPSALRRSRGENAPKDSESAESRSWLRLAAYLPAVVLATAVVIASPIVLATAVMRPGGWFEGIASVAATIAISTGLATIAGATWKRSPYGRDLIFSELMLWGWLRRCWTEWGLHRTRRVYEEVKAASPNVSIDLLERLSEALEARDAYTHGHSRRVARHAVRIARTMGMAPGEVAKVRAAAVVHDVGKLYTPRTILNNPGQLSAEEYEIVKRHAVDGADMLGPVGDHDITAMVRHHHERLDGSGYPDGLTGERIPLGARILAVADTFDAVTSHRSYRRASTHKQGLDVLAREAGSSKLDPAAVAAFRRSYSGRGSTVWLALAAAAPQRLLALLQTSPGIGANAGLATQIVPALGAAGILAAGHVGLHRPAVSDLKAPAMTVGARSHVTSAPHRPAAATSGRVVRSVRHARPHSAPSPHRPLTPSRHIIAKAPKTVSSVPSSGGGGGGGGGSGQTHSSGGEGESTETPSPTPSTPSPEPPPPITTPSPPPVNVPEVPEVEVPKPEVPLPKAPVRL